MLLSETLTYILWNTHSVFADMYEDRIIHIGFVNGYICPPQMGELFCKVGEAP